MNPELLRTFDGSVGATISKTLGKRRMAQPNNYCVYDSHSAFFGIEALQQTWACHSSTKARADVRIDHLQQSADVFVFRGKPEVASVVETRLHEATSLAVGLKVPESWMKY